VSHGPAGTEPRNEACGSQKTTDEDLAIPSKTPFAVATGGLIGRIEIRGLGLSVIVMEGTTKKTLRRAAGHIARNGATPDNPATL
jgi:sortase (surface protein transpeptidase)